MLERLIENWLVSAGERGFETPFAQVLALEGHRVIQGPVHHPFEHGKDILTFHGDQLHAYQLKGPGTISLAEYEQKIQGQILALASTAVTHPAVTPARRADRVFLVTNGVLRPEVRDRIEKFNVGNAALGFPAIEPIEREQLLSRFVKAHGGYLPEELSDIRRLLEMYYADPADFFPVRDFARFIQSVLPFPPADASMPEASRAIASVMLLTAYASASWQRGQNHLCVAQAWLVACLTVLRFANARGLTAKAWKPSYLLALEAARTSLAALSYEAAEAEDLVVPDLVDGIVYGPRAVLVGGYLGAYLLSEHCLGGLDDEGRDRIRTVVARERQFAKISGEADAPLFFLMASALERLGYSREGESMVLSLVSTLSRVNQRHSKRALPDPYHPTEEVILHQLEEATRLENEQFDGHAYTLHVGIEWVTRRLWRQTLAGMWADITHVIFCEFRPSSPEHYLAFHDADGVLVQTMPAQPQSWAALLAQSRQFDAGELPEILWNEHRELVPYLPLLFPQRFTATVAKAIDHIASTA